MLRSFADAGPMLRRLAPLALIVVAMLAIFVLEARWPPKPWPHYTAGYPPGTICTSYGRLAARVCEHDPNYKPTKPTSR